MRKSTNNTKKTRNARKKQNITLYTFNGSIAVEQSQFMPKEYQSQSQSQKKQKFNSETLFEHANIKQINR